MNISFDGIGFNGPVLAGKSKKDFISEVKHHFTGPDGKEKIEDLYALIRATYGKQPDNPKIKQADEE